MAPDVELEREVLRRNGVAVWTTHGDTYTTVEKWLGEFDTELVQSEKERAILGRKLTIAVKALERIAHPLVSIDMEAVRSGARVDGAAAVQLMSTPSYYRQEAEAALAELKKWSESTTAA